MATLDPSEIMFTPFEPKTKNRFIMYIEGVQFDEDFKGRRLLSRLRSVTNNLRIETGRYEGRPVDDRICKSCNEGIEDEDHFLNKCNAYEEIMRDCNINLKIFI